MIRGTRTIPGGLLLIALLCLLAWQPMSRSSGQRGSLTMKATHRTVTGHLPRRAPARTRERHLDLEGSVRSVDGRVLGGAQVCVFPGLQVCVRADASGIFSLSLPSGSAFLIAAAPDYMSRTIAVRHEEPMSAPVSIVLERGGVPVTGTVADSFGGNVTGARVVVASVETGEVLGLTVSDVEGRFHALVHAGHASMTVHADGYSRRTLPIVAPASALAIVLAPASTITGTVQAEGSLEPLAQTTVQAVGTGEFHDLVFDTTTDAKGSFELEALPPGRYDLTIASGLWRSATYPVALAVGASEAVSMLATPAHRVLGRALVAGRPCGSGFAQLRGGTFHAAPVRHDGIVSIDGVPSGGYHVTVHCDGARPLTSELQVGSEPAGPTEWQLEPALSISGRVSSGTGNSQGALNVRVEAVDESLTISCRTDESGNFKCTGLKGGRYRCFVELDGNPVSTVVEVDIDDRFNELVKLELFDAGTVHIRAHQGNPSMTTIALRRGDQHLVYGQAGDDGTYVFHPLPLGGYEVVSIVGSHEEILATVELSRSGQLHELAVEVPTDGSITGQVVDDQLVPVPDAWVTARNTSDIFAGQPGRLAVLTDEQGQFTLKGLAPGEYQVHAETTWAAGDVAAVRTGERIEVALQEARNIQ